MKNFAIVLLTCCFVLIVVGCRSELKEGYEYCGSCGGDGYKGLNEKCYICNGTGQIQMLDLTNLVNKKLEPSEPDKPNEENKTYIYKGRYSVPTQSGECYPFDFEFYSTYITIAGVKYNFLSNIHLSDEVWLDVYYKDLNMNGGVLRSCYGVIASTHEVKVWLYDGEGEPGSGYWADCEETE